MTFDIPELHIADDSPEAQAVERVMHAQHVGPEDAVRHILRAHNFRMTPAQKLMGLFSSAEDADLLDQVVEIAYHERHVPSTRNIGQ